MSNASCDAVVSIMQNGRLVKSRPFAVMQYCDCDYGLRSMQPVNSGFAFSELDTGRLIV